MCSYACLSFHFIGLVGWGMYTAIDCYYLRNSMFNFFGHTAFDHFFGHYGVCPNTGIYGLLSWLNRVPYSGVPTQYSHQYVGIWLRCFFNNILKKYQYHAGTPKYACKYDQYTTIFAYSSHSYNTESPREMSVPIYVICTNKRSMRLEAIVIKKSVIIQVSRYIQDMLHAYRGQSSALLSSIGCRPDSVQKPCVVRLTENHCRPVHCRSGG